MMQGCALCGYIEKAKIPLSNEIIRKKKKVDKFGSSPSTMEVHKKTPKKRKQNTNEIKQDESLSNTPTRLKDLNLKQARAK